MIRKFPLTCLVLLIISQSISAQMHQPQNDSEAEHCTAMDTTLHYSAEELPEFEGGDITTFRNYVLYNLTFPAEAFEQGCTGRVIVKFIVDWDGEVEDVGLLKSSGCASLDEELLNLVRNSPPWRSAKEGGVCVPFQYTLPVTFMFE